MTVHARRLQEELVGGDQPAVPVECGPASKGLPAHDDSVSENAAPPGISSPSSGQTAVLDYRRTATQEQEQFCQGLASLQLPPPLLDVPWLAEPTATTRPLKPGSTLHSVARRLLHTELGSIPQSLLPQMLQSLAASHGFPAHLGSQQAAVPAAATPSSTQLKLVQVRSRIAFNSSPVESEAYQM